MLNTRTLYATTLVLAASAGFSAGWAARPPLKVPMGEEERIAASFEDGYDLTLEEREGVRSVVRRYVASLDRLRKDFDARFGPQIDALTAQYDAELAAICTPAKKR